MEAQSLAAPFACATLLALAVAGCDKPHSDTPEPVRVAVIGGMTMTGLWQAVTDDFTSRTGIPVELVATGPKQIIDEAFRKGGVDLITMHSSDTATNLAADGLTQNMRPWARNELVIVGPPDDPARIRGMTDGAKALAKIAAAKTPFVEAKNVGSQIVTSHLWSLAGIRPEGDWRIRDDSPAGSMVVEFAAKRHAYVIVGRIPVIRGKMPSANMEILVRGDPEMRRPYVVMEANPARRLARNPSGARQLADYLVSARGQHMLRAFSASQDGSAPIFYPGAGSSP